MSAANWLSEVFDTGLKQLLVVVAGNVLEKVFAAALRMSHLAENTSVGRSDTFNCTERAVGIPADGSGNCTVGSAVLSCNLTVFDETEHGSLVGNETSFTVRYGDTVDIASLAACKPRRFD